MTKWINRSLVQAPRNGTSSHTVAFTPATAGNFLVMVIEGAVTHTIPTGWTRRAQALNNTELSVYTKTATANESSFSTTHNGPDYPIGVVVYEFAAGSTWVGGVSDTGLLPTEANPFLSGLTGTNLLFGAVGVTASGSALSNDTTWSGATGLVEDLDLFVALVSTDGYILSVAYVEDSTLASFTPIGSLSFQGSSKEALTFAVKAVAPVSTSKVVKTSSINWAIRRQLIKSTSLSWSIRSTLGKSIVTNWSTRSSLIRTSVSTWAIRSQLGKTISSNWDTLINTSVVKTLASTWAVRGRLEKTTPTSWAVRNPLTRVLATGWATRARAVKSITPSWSVRGKLQKAAATNWAVRQSLGKTSLTSWAARRRLSKVLITRWNAANSGSPVISEIQLMNGQLVYIDGIFDGVDIQLVTVSINP